MHTSLSRPWYWFVAGPAFLALLLAFAPIDAEAAAKKATTTPAKTAAIKTAPANKTPSASNSKNKGKKATSSKKKKGAKKSAKKGKHHKKHAKGKSGGGSGGGLISAIQRDEARLISDLNRLKKLLR